MMNDLEQYESIFDISEYLRLDSKRYDASVKGGDSFEQ